MMRQDILRDLNYLQAILKLLHLQIKHICLALAHSIWTLITMAKRTMFALVSGQTERFVAMNMIAEEMFKES